MRQLLMVGSLFFDHHYLWKETNDVLNLFYRNNHQGKAPWYYLFCLDVANCASCPIKLQDSLISSISKRDQYLRIFACRYFHQWKVACITTTFGWVRLVVSYSKRDQYLRIFACRYFHQWKVACITTTLGWVRLVVSYIQYSQKKLNFLWYRKIIVFNSIQEFWKSLA